MNDASPDPTDIKLPEYDDPEATRPHEGLVPMSSAPSTRALVPRSEARINPLVEVWAWLADEFEDRSAADPGGLMQLAEVLALAGHADAARDTARAAFELAPARVAIARQFRALAPPAERASSAYAEATAATSPAARLHAFVHAWLAAHLAGSPRPLALEDMPLGSWLGACASGVADPQAIADVVLAADYVAQMQTGGWETSYAAAGAVAAGLPREPQKVAAGFERLVDACAGAAELKPALPWLKRWAKLPLGGADAHAANEANDEPTLAALLALQAGGEAALAQWLRFQAAPPGSTADTEISADNHDGQTSGAGREDAERLLRQLTTTDPTTARKVDLLISPTDTRIAELLESSQLSASDRVQLEGLLEQRRLLALPEDARKLKARDALQAIENIEPVATLRASLDALASNEDSRERILSGLGSWVAAAPNAWGEQAKLLLEHELSKGPAMAFVADLLAGKECLPKDEATRHLYEALVAHVGSAPAGFEASALESLAAEWVETERAQSGSDAQRRDWVARAQELSPESPWLQRYAEELTRLDGNDLYARLVPPDEIAQAESRGDLHEAVRLTLARMPSASTAEQQRALYICLARLYGALGDSEKAAMCTLEADKRRGSTAPGAS